MSLPPASSLSQIMEMILRFLHHLSPHYMSGAPPSHVAFNDMMQAICYEREVCQQVCAPLFPGLVILATDPCASLFVPLHLFERIQCEKIECRDDEGCAQCMDF